MPLSAHATQKYHRFTFTHIQSHTQNPEKVHAKEDNGLEEKKKRRKKKKWQQFM